MATAGGRIIQTKLLLLQINYISFFVGIQTLNFAYFSSLASICLYFGNIAFTLWDSQLEFQILWNSVRVSTSNCTAEQLFWFALDMFHVQLLKCSQFTLSLIFRQNKWALVSKCGCWTLSYHRAKILIGQTEISYPHQFLMWSYCFIKGLGKTVNSHRPQSAYSSSAATSASLFPTHLYPKFSILCHMWYFWFECRICCHLGGSCTCSPCLLASVYEYMPYCSHSGANRSYISFSSAWIHSTSCGLSLWQREDG